MAAWASMAAPIFVGIDLGTAATATGIDEWRDVAGIIAL